MSLNDTGDIGGRQAQVYSDPAWDDLRKDRGDIKAEVAALKGALEAQVYHFEQAMNNEDCGPWYEAVQDAKLLIARVNK